MFWLQIQWPNQSFSARPHLHGRDVVNDILSWFYSLSASVAGGRDPIILYLLSVLLCLSLAVKAVGRGWGGDSGGMTAKAAQCHMQQGLNWWLCFTDELSL